MCKRLFRQNALLDRSLLLNHGSSSFCIGVPVSKPTIIAQQEQGPEFWGPRLVNSGKKNSADFSLDPEQTKPAQALAWRDCRAWEDAVLLGSVCRFSAFLPLWKWHLVFSLLSLVPWANAFFKIPSTDLHTLRLL